MLERVFEAHNSCVCTTAGLIANALKPGPGIHHPAAEPVHERKKKAYADSEITPQMLSLTSHTLGQSTDAGAFEMRTSAAGRKGGS